MYAAALLCSHKLALVTAKMPVTGLPVPVEAMLTSFLATHDLSSWKVTGESGTGVVVLRFRVNDGRPLGRLECNTKKGIYKRKSPSQLLRDEQRVKQYRAKGELKASAALLNENVEENVIATSTVSNVDGARDSRAATGTNRAAVSTLTLDPSSAHVCSETQPPSAPAVSMQEPPPKTTSTYSQVHPSDV